MPPLPETNDVTRREFLIGAVGLLLLPAGCGSGEEAPVRVEYESGLARTVSHAFGKTEVPRDPERVLALGQEDMLADLLSIGVKPVASLSNLADSFPGLAPEETEGIEPILATGEVSLEQFTALSPDLIVGHDFFVEQAGYEELSRIAPTVAVAAEDTTAAYFQTLAVFGEEETARRRVEEFEDRLRTAGEELGAGGRTVSLATVYPGPSLAAWVDGPTPVPKLVLDLGFRLAPDRDEVEGLLARALPGVFGGFRGTRLPERRGARPLRRRDLAPAPVLACRR
jgi:iron complex transport system substrate-binding protein